MNCLQQPPSTQSLMGQKSKGLDSLLSLLSFPVVVQLYWSESLASTLKQTLISAPRPLPSFCLPDCVTRELDIFNSTASVQYFLEEEMLII